MRGDSKDDVAFERILNIPKRGIGRKSIRKIRDIDLPCSSLREKSSIAIQKKISLQKAAGDIGMVPSIFESIEGMMSKHALEEIIDITHCCQYLETYTGEGDDGSITSRLENID